MRKLVPLVAILAALLLTSCNENNQEVSNFFLLLIFLFAMIFGGTPAIVFSAISLKSTKTAIYVLATVFTVIYLLVSVAMLPVYSDASRFATPSTVYMIYTVHFGGLIVSIVLTILGYVNRAKGNVNKVKSVTAKTEEEELEFLDQLLDEGEDEK